VKRKRREIDAVWDNAIGPLDTCL